MKLFEAPPGMCFMPDDTVKEIAAKDAEIDLLQEQNAEMQQAIADLSDLANDVVRLEAQLVAAPRDVIAYLMLANVSGSSKEIQKRLDAMLDE